MLLLSIGRWLSILSARLLTLGRPVIDRCRLFNLQALRHAFRVRALAASTLLFLQRSTVGRSKASSHPRSQADAVPTLHAGKRNATLVLFEMAKGWLTGEQLEAGETHETRTGKASFLQMAVFVLLTTGR